jgi:Mrp family chromosome partitioning ATPase
MSRIDKALRRATDGTPADQQVDPFSLQDYTAEPESATDAERGTKPGPATAPHAKEPIGTVNAAPPQMPPDGTAQTERTSVSVSPAPTVLSSSQFTVNAGSALIQQCRRLAGVLHDRQVDRGLKRVAIASADDTEGKTHTAVNLALTLTRTFANRVLLIDADLRQPFVHELVGGPNEIGLSDALRGNREIPLVQVSPLLHVLTVGRPPSNALPDLMSVRMPALVDDSAKRYDWVLLNAPAMSRLPESQVLLRVAQGVVFVVGASTSFPRVEAAIEELGRECIIGTVLVGVDERFLPPAPHH